MLEIIILYFLTKEIGKTAYSKGLKPLTWKLYTVGVWLLFEIIGFVIGLIIFGVDNIISAALVGIAFAVTGYFILRAQLNKLPNKIDDDIERIGRN